MASPESIVGSSVSFTSKKTGEFFEGTVYFFRPDNANFGIDYVSRTHVLGSRNLVEGCYQFSLNDIKDLRVIRVPGVPKPTTTDTEKDDQKSNPGDASSSTLPSKWVSDVKYQQAITKSQDVQESFSYCVNVSHAFNPREDCIYEIFQNITSPYYMSSCLCLSLPVPKIETCQAIKTSLLHIPHEITLQILAPAPKRLYPILSCVSKDVDHLIRSSSLEIHQLRRKLDKDRVYVCFSSESSDHRPWFCLRVNNDKPSDDVFTAEVVLPDNESLQDVFAFGPEIILVCGTLQSPTKVLLFDIRSSLLREAPNMPETLGYLNSGLVGHELYVYGNQFYLKNIDRRERCENEAERLKRYTNHAARLNLKTQTWDGYFPTRNMKRSLTTATVDKKIYMIKGDGSVFDPRDGSRSSFEMPYYIDNKKTWTPNAVCVMDNTLFSYHTCHGLSWYDTSTKTWKDVSNSTVEGKSKWFACALKEYFGNLALLSTDLPLCDMKHNTHGMWTDTTGDEDLSDRKDVWLNIITLRREGLQIHGEVGPSKLLGTIPSDYRFSKSVSTIG